MADKDTREDDGTPRAVLPLSDVPPSEGGPVTQEPEPRTEGGEARPKAVPEVSDAVPPVAEAAPVASEPEPPGVPAALRSEPDLVSESLVEIAPGTDAVAPEEQGAEAHQSFSSDLVAERAPIADVEAEAEMKARPQARAAEPSEPVAWHSMIADALAEEKAPQPAARQETEPSPPELALPRVEPRLPDNSSSEPPTAGVPPVQASLAVPAPAHPFDPRLPEGDGGAVTAAFEDLFRPADVREEPHLITLGRRLDPSLRIARPVLPDIAVPAEPPVVVLPPRWKNVPWGRHLRTAARYAFYAIVGYFALVLVLILLFRFVNPPGSSYMLGQLLTGTAIDRTWVPLRAISPHLVRAVVVSEDGRFCEHSGIDTAAMKEAIERAARGTPRGASTISMQVTKNLFLWNAKSYLRKVIEIPLTLVMEIIWPKHRILEVYLNIAEWGPGVFGAEAAAQRHFNKTAARLTERESALLAAVLPNPVVRDAGAPGPQTSAKARVVQARVKAYGAVASCAVRHAASAAPAVARPAARSANRKAAAPAAPRPPTPQRKQPAPADEWAPTLKFGPR